MAHTSNCGKDMKQQKLSSLPIGMQTSTAILEDSLMVFKNLIFFPYDSAIMFLGIYPKEVKPLSTQKATRGCV